MSLSKRSGHTGLPTLSNFMTFGHSGTECQKKLVPECPNVKKIKKGGLDQYDPEHFEV